MAKKLDLTTKNRTELFDLLSKEREELRKARFEAAGSRPKDASSAKKARRSVARILTVLHATRPVHTSGAAEKGEELAETEATA